MVENHPVSLGGLTSIKPRQVWWFDHWLATVALMVGKKDTWTANYSSIKKLNFAEGSISFKST